MLCEIHPRMCHDHHRARLPSRRHIQKPARLGAVPRIKLHDGLLHRRIDIAKINWVTGLIIGWRLRHDGLSLAPPSLPHDLFNCPLTPWSFHARLSAPASRPPSTFPLLMPSFDVWSSPF